MLFPCRARSYFYPSVPRIDFSSSRFNVLVRSNIRYLERPQTPCSSDHWYPRKSPALAKWTRVSRWWWSHGFGRSTVRCQWGSCVKWSDLDGEPRIIASNCWRCNLSALHDYPTVYFWKKAKRCCSTRASYSKYRPGYILGRTERIWSFSRAWIFARCLQLILWRSARFIARYSGGPWREMFTDIWVGTLWKCS